ALRRMGVGLIPPNEGVARFMHALTHDLADPQMIVTGALGEIDTWRPAGRDKCSAKLRYVDNITSFQPGVSLTTRCTLSHQDDPYLLDHIYEGTCLFPAVFGLEAMSQVASHVMNESPTLVRIQNVQLSRPIIVGQEGNVQLEITAEASEACAMSGETVVKVGIRTERTQFQFAHFACEVVFGTPVAGPREREMIGERLDLDPQRDLYTGILFQGPRFQRWGDTYQLQEGKMTFDVSHCNHTCAGRNVFGPRITSGPLMTGDPFFRDVLLQSVQAVIPQKTGLPLSIEKIEFFSPAKDGEQANRRLVTSQLHVIADEVGKEHVCEVVAKDPFGEVRERMTGYRVKVLAIKEEYPTATQLADLATFDSDLFAKQTKSVFSDLGAKAPVMNLKRLQLHGMSKNDRHIAEKPMMEATVHMLQQRNGNANGTPMIDLMASGRPVVTSDAVCKLSLTHDDDYCLCIANTHVAGCDLAPITERSREQWEALVGMHNAPLLEQLMAGGDCINKAGTRIWAAVEAAQKATDDAAPVSLRMGASKDGAVAFITDQLDHGSVLITTPVVLHRKPARILAVVAPTNSTMAAPMMESAPAAAMPAAPAMPVNRMTAAQPAMPQPAMPSANGNGSGQLLMPSQPMSAQPAMSSPMAPAMAAPKMEAAPVPASPAPMTGEPSMRTDVAARGEERAIENVRAHIKWDGPNDQAVFEHRFCVTFKECAMRGKHVQHTQYLGWMGSMRENGLLYLVPDMVIKLSDGLTGMATNWTDIDVVGEAMMGDVIVARLFMEEMTDATVTLCCDFARRPPNGRLERLATVRQATTWVKLHGRSEPTKEAFPKFLFDAFKSMEPPRQGGTLPELPESLGRLKLEQRKLEAITPAAGGTVLGSETFKTCMDDSNIVANIYYARYFHWQWRTSDQFLFNHVPQLVREMTALGNVRELVQLNCHIDHVRDGFPFDLIRTELAVTRTTETAATFRFTHYRVDEAGNEEKLCVGTQDVCWVRRTPSGTPVPEPFPLAVQQAFKGMYANIV
ncbi:MAG: polyketide synthase dehydratase domain-containing protein, partial [Planctomycetaceae bacterium]